MVFEWFLVVFEWFLVVFEWFLSGFGVRFTDLI